MHHQKNFCYGGVSRHPSCADVREQRPAGAKSHAAGKVYPSGLSYVI